MPRALKILFLSGIRFKVEGKKIKETVTKNLVYRRLL